MDDGSTDDATRALLETYRQPKTRVIKTEHQGVSAARNVAIAQARGNYLCALDADDRLEPTYFEKAVAVLDHDPDLAFVSCWLRAFGDEEWDWKPERCDLPTLLWEDTVLTAALVRREAITAVGGYDTQMPAQGAEDWDLWLTLTSRGYRGTILHEVLFNYRRRAGSLSKASWYGEDHLPLTSYRVQKHSALYRAHLLDVFEHQDTETSALLRLNADTEHYLASELEPAVAARRQEFAGLRARLEAARRDETERADLASAAERAHDLETALTAAHHEIAALRTSMSWRITRPLRAAYGRWLHWKGMR